VTDDTLTQLLDERAVRGVMLRYALGVDDRDWERVRGCFAADAAVQGTGYSGARDEYLAHLRVGVERFGVTMHTIGNQVVEIDGDAARTETDLIARHFVDEAGTDEVLVLGVRYLDRLRRAGDDWVVVHREVRRRWSRP
jgi:hypothetical protein